MKKSKKFVYIFIAVLVFLFQFGFFAPSANAYSSALRINNSTGGPFAVGKAWALTLTSNLGSVPINICALHPDGVRTCTPPQQLPGGPCSSATDATGYWYCSQTFPAGTVGQWAEWVSAPSLGYDGSASGDVINFNVIGGSISASPTSCTIPVNGNSCPLSFTWSTLGNAAAPQSVIFDNIPNQIFPSVALSGTQNFNVAHGNGNFTLHNSGIVVATSQFLSATCASGSTWNGSSCVANAGPVNGICSGTAYNCFAGTSSNNVNGASYTWSCVGSGGGSTAFCSQAKSSGPADLTVSDFHLTNSAGTAKSTFAPNENIYPSVTIQNTGGTATSSSSGFFYVSIYSNSPSTAGIGQGSDVNIWVYEPGPIGAGASKTYSIISNNANWTNNGQVGTQWIKAAAGSYTARAFVDSYNYVAESNENNNQATSVYTIGSAAVNGVCSATHYGCTTGTSATNAEGPAWDWTWACNGSGGGTNASCSQPIPSPTNFVSSCPSPGTSANLSWTLPVGYNLSYFRVIDNITGINPPYFIPENVTDTGPAISMPTIPGHNYTAWVHTRLPSGAYSREIYSSFSCAAGMSGTLTPASGSCSILNGDSSCTIPFTWTTTNPVGTSAVTSPYPVANTHVSVPDANAGTNVPFAIPFASTPRSFYLYNNAILLAQSTVTSSCVAGTGWNGTTCSTTVNGACSSPQTHYTCLSGTSANNVNGASYTWDCAGSGGGSTASCSEAKVAGISITANPTTIVAGGSSTLTWSGSGVCTGTNFNNTRSSPGTNPVVSTNSTGITVSPTSTITYTLTCDGQPATATVTVRKQPIFVEP